MENELNEWKNRYSLLERMKDQELESFKSSSESRRKSLLNREMRELTLKFQSDKAQMEVENKRLKEVIDLRQLEIEEISQNCEQMEGELGVLKKTQSRAFELEEKNNSLNKEVELVSYNLSLKAQQLEKLERNYRDTDLYTSDKVQEFQNVIQFKEKQISDQNLQFIQLRKQIDGYASIEQRFMESDKQRQFF